MSVSILSVRENSICSRQGIMNGFKIISINGNDINDVFDFRFYGAAKRLHVVFADNDNNIVEKHIKATGNVDDLGLEFSTYLMDKQHCCKNKCIFCFVDQMPDGMRESLYFKDDDSRLSFLFGNYVTLTNMAEKDIKRLIDMHISPVNISVHTMNPELRVKMMKNPNAGKVLEFIKMLADGGVEINAQLVLCPGINDGRELEYSLNELYKIGEKIISVAAVPVGLTKFRKDLCPIEGYNKETASAVINMIDNFNKAHYEEINRNFVFAADEFYLQAEREMPDCEYYDEFRQLDNGVGTWALTKQEFYDALDSVSECKAKKIALITGVAAGPLINELAKSAEKKFEGLTADVFTVVNDFFGHSVTVAGLVTAGDIIAQVGKLSEYEKALIPSVMLRDGDEKIFLDDITVDELSEKLNVKIESVSGGGKDLLYKIVGRESE